MTRRTDPATRAGQAEFVRWFGPLLDALRALGGSASPREAVDRVGVQEGISSATLNEVLRSGQSRFYNQVHWARQYLVWEGLIDSGKRGVWSLTPKGRDTRLDAATARQLFLRQVKRHGALRRQTEVDSSSAVDNEVPTDTPQSDQDSTLEAFLRVVRGLSPKGFEQLCMRLLREAGFERVQVTGRSNDGGVDGIGVLQVNDLVSFNVVFQCKKWEQAVPPKEVRDLRGAMDGRAEKGILLTTGTFSMNARVEAERQGAAPIELVDGVKLFEMVKKFELGLKPRVVYDVDPTFFEQFG